METSDEAIDKQKLVTEVTHFFADSVKLLGLPKSVGEIYGSLYISKQPMSIDCLVGALEISKGSVSQGLKMLRTLGAVKEVNVTDGRKVYYEADVELKSLVGGFIRTEIRPQLVKAKERIEEMEGLLDGDEFYQLRVKKLSQWRKSAGLLLPIVQKILAS